MTPFFVGLLTGSWLTVSSLTWTLLALDGEVRGWWRLRVAAAAPVLVAWHVAGWGVEWVKERCR